MLNIFLNIIGIILVIYSIFIIRKDITIKQDANQKQINKTFDNEKIYEFNDEVVEEFDLLMDKEIRVKRPYKKTIAIIQDEIISSNDDSISPLHKKIMELKSIGLSNEEIAKKMGRGVREIDIILKIYKTNL